MIVHWSDVDPGPLTPSQRDHRVQQILTEMRTEQSAAERANGSRMPARWRKAFGREHHAEMDRLTVRLAREQNRPLTRQENP